MKQFVFTLSLIKWRCFPLNEIILSVINHTYSQLHVSYWVISYQEVLLHKRFPNKFLLFGGYLEFRPTCQKASVVLADVSQPFDLSLVLNRYEPVCVVAIQAGENQLDVFETGLKPKKLWSFRVPGAKPSRISDFCKTEKCLSYIRFRVAFCRLSSSFRKCH